MHCNKWHFRFLGGFFIILAIQFTCIPTKILANQNELDTLVQQLHLYNLTKPIEYSTVGMITLGYVPEATSYFINIVAKDKAGELRRWIVRNLYIPDASWIASPQSISVRFSLETLGYSPGEAVKVLILSINKSTTVWAEIPAEPKYVEFKVDTLRDDAQGDITLIPPNTPKIGVYPSFPDFNTGDQIKPVEFRGCRVPNLDLNDLSHPDTKDYAGDLYACGPAAATNSLGWLDSAYKDIQLPGLEREVMEELSKLMKRSSNSGVTIENFIRGKLDFIETHNLPINMKFQSSFYSDDVISSSGKTLAINENIDNSDAYPTWDWLVKQMDAGEDVEMMYYWLDGETWHGHAVVVTGVEEGDDGIKKTIKFKHDVWQGAAGGTKQEDESVYIDSHGRMILRFRGAFIGNVVAESYGDPHPTPVELGLFTAEVINNDAHLMWKTESESNNYGFEILRNNEKITFVEGKGTTVESQTYSYIDAGLNGGSYCYELVQIDFDGKREIVGSTSILIMANPTEYVLAQNYPNPFNAVTKIKYIIPARGLVSLKIYNMLGEEVLELVSEEQEAGNYTVDFDASPLANGIYFYRMEVSGFSQIRKFLLLK